jgi:hypothetical protein
MSGKVWRGVTVPQFPAIDNWITRIGAEQDEVIPVWRIIGTHEGKDFTWDWRIRPEVERRQEADGGRFHAGRIESLMGTPPDYSDRWGPQDALNGGQENRLPQMVKLHGFYWNRDDGNHRIVVAKRLGYPRMRVLFFQARLRPNVPTGIQSWIGRVERWATGRHDGNVSLETPPPRSPPIPVSRLPKGMKLGRPRVLVIGPNEPTLEDDVLPLPRFSPTKGRVNRNPKA